MPQRNAFSTTCTTKEMVLYTNMLCHTVMRQNAKIITILEALLHKAYNRPLRHATIEQFANDLPNEAQRHFINYCNELKESYQIVWNKFPDKYWHQW